MKQLTLLRHAKTKADSPSGRDFDRVLEGRGEQDAARLGEDIRNLGLKADLVLASPAARARQTAALAGLAPEFDERIYNASTGDLLAIVQQAPDRVGHLLIVGHNPGFERLASMLTGTSVDMPTGALVEIALPISSWADAGGECGTLVRFVSPKSQD